MRWGTQSSSVCPGSIDFAMTEEEEDYEGTTTNNRQGLDRGETAEKSFGLVGPVAATENGIYRWNIFN